MCPGERFGGLDWDGVVEWETSGWFGLDFRGGFTNTGSRLNVGDKDWEVLGLDFWDSNMNNN